ncbi:MAG TPA: bifunctional precorrin-2 dehydrogenase/sirohydrochlorin ferrochelatase [Geobacteraceae bacterium]|nr:bifunctional precorrin-2 dehydrogenase/sirohydrochlorin ferrochelatase [Geobacteraceae bacterium]
MRYLPINLDIRGKKVVIVGSGSVAERKCLSVLSAGALVTVISPTLTGTLQELCNKGEIDYLQKEYSSGDLNGAFLVFAATDRCEVNSAVADEAKERCILADITDSPERSNFTSPAFISRDELLITVSTGGEAPALAGKIREELESRYGPEYAELTRILGRVREKLLTEKLNNQYNKKIMHSLVDQELSALLKQGAYAEIDRVLENLCGPGFTLAELGIGKRT